MKPGEEPGYLFMENFTIAKHDAAGTITRTFNLLDPACPIVIDGNITVGELPINEIKSVKPSPFVLVKMEAFEEPVPRGGRGAGA